MLRRVTLDKGWKFKQSTTLNNGCASEYLPVGQFPTVSHLDLLHHGLIPDPYLEMNELDCLWVNDADWVYRTQEVGPVEIGKAERVYLVFEGLDTVVDVYLNNNHILFANNMHIPYRVDVTDLLAGRDEPSSLELRFRNAPDYARSEQSRMALRGKAADAYKYYAGKEARFFLRKAQYHWGWDWGPVMSPAGPYKPIFLEVFRSRIQDLVVRQEVTENLDSAMLSVTGTVENYCEGDVVRIEVRDPSNNLIREVCPDLEDGSFQSSIVITKPQLWYPFAYGAQPLYKIKTTLGDKDANSKTIGLRRLRLLQHPLKDAEGTSFLFEVNNIRIFCGGSNWIPGDMLLPRMTTQRYEDWLLLAKSGNQAMIRVWGGGVIEPDAFYDICDREGILVWQDFLFACGNFPTHPDYLENVQKEAEFQLKSIGHHPCIVVWAGNNEDYMIADLLGLDNDYSDQEGPWDHTSFPGRKIYERVLPEICARLSGDVPYLRSSPYGGKSANDPTVGDTHCWDVWHLKMSPYQQYKAYTSRFITEFGFESAPNIRTLHEAIKAPEERQWQSRTFDAHDKGPAHERRYGMYMGENFRFRLDPLEDFVYCSQFLQAEAMSYAYNHWRRAFRGHGEELCAGVLVWQLNDIWPGASWALVDYRLNPKPGFYVTKRALSSIVVGMSREVTEPQHYLTRSFQDKRAEVDIWVVNGTLETVKASLRVRAFDIQTGQSVATAYADTLLDLPPNKSTEITKLAIPNHEHTVVVAYLDDAATAQRLARFVSWHEPLKYVRFAPQARVDYRLDGDHVVLSSKTPLKGVVISVPAELGKDADFDDNFVDLVPEEEYSIHVGGLDGRQIQVRWLCDWEKSKSSDV